ncbi:MAG: septation protein IspZ [Alphaproteobacteria bacterium]|nr:septation protein IspZ [Alphaproteobacteria bacterium]
MGHLAEALKPLVADLASSIFFAVLIAVTGNIYLATGIGMAIGVAQILYLKVRRKPVSAMQWTSLALVIVFGSLTLYLHDPRFVMVKFAIAHVAIGAAMLQPNWMSRYLPKIVTDTLSVRELTIYSAMWPVMMFGIAAAGLYIGLYVGQAAWTWFLGTINPAAPWVLLAIQYVLIRLHVRSIIRRNGGLPVAAAE